MERSVMTINYAHAALASETKVIISVGQREQLLPNWNLQGQYWRDSSTKLNVDGSAFMNSVITSGDRIQLHGISFWHSYTKKTTLLKIYIFHNINNLCWNWQSSCLRETILFCLSQCWVWLYQNSTGHL